MKSLAVTLACCSVLWASLTLRAADGDNAPGSPTKICLTADAPGLAHCGCFRLPLRLADMFGQPLGLGGVAEGTTRVCARLAVVGGSRFCLTNSLHSLQAQHVRWQV